MGHQYVSRSKAANKPHNIKSEELTALFIKVGWIGKVRVPHHFLKVVPFFDIGPGPDIGR
jgi:hypothetical protein